MRVLYKWQPAKAEGETLIVSWVCSEIPPVTSAERVASKITWKETPEPHGALPLHTETP